VQTGDKVMIGGFTIPGTQPKGIILRAIGPELGKYGISNALTDPTLELYDSKGDLIAFNDNWQNTATGGVIPGDQVGGILDSGLAPGDRNESAINATLPPGNYTAIVRGVNNTTGVALLAGHRTSPTYTWTGAVDSHWENSANWNPNGDPQPGDTAAILSGTSNSPTISDRNIKDVHIVVGSSGGGPVTLSASSVHFIEGALTVTGGAPGPSPVTAMLSCQGDVSFVLPGKKEEKKGVEGTITVEAMGGALTIDAGDGTFTLTDSSKRDIDATGELEAVAASKRHKAETQVLVTQECGLFFKGRHIVNEEIIQVEGAAEIAEDVALEGSGIITVDSGGQLFIEGAVASGQAIFFADGTGRVSIGNPTMFHGTVGFTPVAGARIDFPGIQAQSVGIRHSGKDQFLRLYAGPNLTGGIIAELNVESVDEIGLSPIYPPRVPALSRNDFTLSSDGKGGTFVTYLPQGTIYLEQSMPVPVIAFRNSKVSLQTIFSQSFGTSTPGFYSITLLPTGDPKNTPKDFKYWGDAPEGLQVPPAWFVNGGQITREKFPKGYKVRDTDNVELLVGNNISDPAQFNAQVTRASSGSQSEFVTYSVWTVDPEVAKGVELTPGKPTPADIVASAHSLFKTFPDCPNTNLCNWIGDNVTAVAGAPMPLPNAHPDPTDNVEGGFWRFAYTGARPNPVKNWFRLVAPGDVIRMQHLFGGGHTTTALSRQHANGTITVYSNGVRRFISIHESTAEEGTDPASITIYRLDPNQQYLILGTSLGEIIQGSVYNNLIKPGGGSDVVIAGPSNNEIQDLTANLNGITVRNFHSGDVLNFTDLHPNGTTAQYDLATGTLSVSHSGQQVATIIMRGLSPSAQFSVSSNLGGGTKITLSP
jgi:hypothetical protein